MLCVLLAGGLIFAGWQLLGPKTVLSDPAHRQKLAYLEKLIDQYYLEDKDEEELAEGIYTGLVYGLGDPYSVYYTAEQYEEASASHRGRVCGNRRDDFTEQ